MTVIYSLSVKEGLPDPVSGAQRSKRRELFRFDGTEREAVEAAVRAGVDLGEAFLRHFHLSGVDLSGVDLSQADLSYADLHGSILHDADLHRARLSCADLRGADMRGADMRHASLGRANLYLADVSGADLSHARLLYANTVGIIIGDAKIETAHGLALSFEDRERWYREKKRNKKYNEFKFK